MIHWRAPGLDLVPPRGGVEGASDAADGASATESDSIRTLQELGPAQLIERVLLPQHRIIRSKLAAITRLTASAPRAQGSRSHLRLHVALMVEELATLVIDDLGREERDLFPHLIAGEIAQAELGELHYRHGEIDERLARARELTAVRSAHPDVDPEGQALFQLLAELATLIDRHHACESAALFADRP